MDPYMIPTEGKNVETLFILYSSFYENEKKKKDKTRLQKKIMIKNIYITLV